MPHIDTLLLHAGLESTSTHGPRSVPIYQTAAYNFDSSAHAADLFALKDFGYIYSRIGNPTQSALEARLAALDGGTNALALASGHAAMSLCILNLARAGQNIVTASNLYGGTYNLFAHTLPRFGIDVRFVDSSDAANFAAAADENTRAFYCETIGNPGNNVDDFQAIADLAHARGIPLIVDNTVAPGIFRPFEHGADLVLYSLTKFASGNGTTMGGAIVEKGDFPWNNGLFPEFVDPDPSYHGVQYWQAFGDHDQAAARGMAFLLRARVQLLRDLGPALAPMNAWLILNGLETLLLRMDRHCATALRIAQHLEAHPAVERVIYPGLESHPDRQRAQRYLQGNNGGLIGFELKGGREAGQRFVEQVRLIGHMANLGDSRSIVVHPASTTHSQLTDEQQRSAGVSPGYLRLSIGLEHPDDLRDDIDQALDTPGGTHE